jgi:WD repeat-containing protein 61
MKLAGLKSVDGAHDESIWAAVWAPAADHRPTALLLTGALDETVRVWRPDDLAAVGAPARGHALGVVSLAAHPAGALAAAVSLDSYIRVFDVDSGASVAMLEAPPSEVWGVQFHPKGNALAAAGGGSGSVKLWDTEKWQPITSLAVPRPEGARPDKTGSGKFVLSVAWSPDGKLLACGSMDGTIAVYDAVRMKFLHHLEGHHMPVRSMVFSPVDPHVLFTACDDCHIHIYDAKEKSLIGAMSGHASWVLSIDMSPDGMAVATGSSDRTVRLWDINMRALVQTMSNHSDQVWAVAFRPPGGTGVRAGRLASVSDDKGISLYDYS